MPDNLPVPEFDPEKVERRMPQQLFGPKWVLAWEYDLLLAERNRLKAALEQVDDVLVTNWVGPRVDGDYERALADLVDFNIKIATDPAVNGGFELVKKGTD